MAIDDRLAAVVERQARQLRGLGIALLVIGAGFVALGIHAGVTQGWRWRRDLVQLLGFGILIIASGVGTGWRARLMRRELARRRSE